MCGPVNAHGLTMMARSVELIKINIIIIYNNYSVSDLFNIKRQEVSDSAGAGRGGAGLMHPIGYL